jgi:multicomponent Na+:H+ antiporter subunit G
VTALAWAGVVTAAAGALFFLAGTVGLVRFPDGFSRLHALAKADHLGLGLTAAGMAMQAASAAVALKLVLTWLLVLVAGATCSYLIADASAPGEGPPRPGGADG